VLVSLVTTFADRISELARQVSAWDPPTIALAALSVATLSFLVSLLTFIYNVRSNRRRGRSIRVSLNLLEGEKLKAVVIVRNRNSEAIYIENWYAVRRHRPLDNPNSCDEDVDSTTELPEPSAVGPEVPLSLPCFTSAQWQFGVDPPEAGSWYRLRVVVQTGLGDRIVSNEIYLPLDWYGRLKLGRAGRAAEHPRRRSLLP
jgi:hypothetical protein